MEIQEWFAERYISSEFGEMSEVKGVVVVDSGSGTCKAGFAGDDKPKDSVASVVGHPLTEHTDDKSLKSIYVGQNAVDKRDVLALTYPADRGIVKNWEDMEELWNYMFSNSLQIDPKEYAVMMIESPESNINKKNREKIYEVMFEKFEVAGMHVAIDSVLSLLASGRKTGIVCTSGDTLSHIVPIYEGFQIPDAMITLNLGGRNLTDYLEELLTEKGYSFKVPEDNRSPLLKDVKEKHAYVALDFDKELESLKTDLEQKYTFPDKYEISLDQERFKCAEPLFDPSLLGIQSDGLDELIFKCIKKCDIDIRRDLYHNVVLAGGTTMLPGFVERIRSGLQSLVPKAITVGINAPVDRAISAWVGGSGFGASPAFQRQLITLQQYTESGLQLSECGGVF